MTFLVPPDATCFRRLCLKTRSTPLSRIIAAILLAGILGLTGIAVIDLTIALQRLIRKTSSRDKVGNNLRARKRVAWDIFETD
jgi:hypothetical protein